MRQKCLAFLFVGAIINRPPSKQRATASRPYTIYINLFFIPTNYNLHAKKTGKIFFTHLSHICLIKHYLCYLFCLLNYLVCVSDCPSKLHFSSLKCSSLSLSLSLQLQLFSVMTFTSFFCFYFSFQIIYYLFTFCNMCTSICNIIVTL